MIDHLAMQLAMQAKLLTLLVCTTGAQTLSATATGWRRAAGSFLVDGFVPGMEVTPAGFATNVAGVVTNVTATDLTVTLYQVTTVNGVRTVTYPAMTIEAPAPGRTLSVGLPTLRAWENVALKKVPGVPYFEEQYIPGPTVLATIGPNGLLIAEPMYSPRVYVPAGVGIAAGGAYLRALLTLFTSKTVLALPNGDTLRVRGDVGPFLGQRHPDADENWSVEPVTIPFRCYTPNSL